MQELFSKLETLGSKEDFVEFVRLLVEDLRTRSSPWENDTLESYLEGLAGWTEDMDGYFKNMQLPVPANVDWKLFANILMAAKIYE